MPPLLWQTENWAIQALKTERTNTWLCVMSCHSDMAHIQGQRVMKSHIQSDSKRCKMGQKMETNVEIIRTRSRHELMIVRVYECVCAHV